MLIQRATVIDPHSAYNQQLCDIRIKDGLISEIAKGGSLSPSGEEVIADEGLCVSPAWVDSGVVLADPGFEHKEKLPALAAAAAFGGFSRIICYPNTDPVIDHAQMIHALGQRSSQLPVRFHFMGAISKGAKGKELAEAYDMQQAGAVGFSDGLHPLQSSGLILRALQYYQAFGGRLISYPTEDSLSLGGQMNESTQSTQLGLKGIPEIAESSRLAALLQLLDYAGGHLHIQPLSSPLALRLIQQFDSPKAKLTVGGSIAHLCFDDSLLADFDENFKLIPPLRDASQLKALQEGLRQGKFDLLYSGHHAQSLEEKQLEFARAEPGILMLQTAFSLAYTHLVSSGIISLEKLISLLSHGPRKVFGLDDRSIQEGQVAELTLFQPEAKWTFGREHLFSPAQNTPFLQQELTGKVVKVIC